MAAVESRRHLGHESLHLLADHGIRFPAVVEVEDHLLDPRLRDLAEPVDDRLRRAEQDGVGPEVVGLEIGERLADAAVVLQRRRDHPRCLELQASVIIAVHDHPSGDPEKPSFRSAYRRRRCLIPADGFYEWQRLGKTRQPWLFGLRDGAPFAFAGLWERWTVPEGAALTGSLAELGAGDPVETCTILTTAANETVAPVHGRMPVILPRDACDPWLAGEDVSLAPYAPDAMTAHPVSTLVNRPANDDPRCVEPVSLT